MEVTKTQIVEDGYYYDVYHDENGNEIGRSGCGMTEQKHLDFYFNLLNEMCKQGLAGELLQAIREVKAGRATI
jgi:hypothetical protein